MQARFPNPRHTLLPGQFGRVQVETQIQKNVVLVPQRAIQQVQNLRTVFTVEPGNKIAVRPVTTGQRDRRKMDHRVGLASRVTRWWSKV